MLIRTDFQTRLALANAGERITYHTGDLMFDRVRGSQLDVTASAAWDAHLAGECLLVQKRIGPNVWEYIAIRATGQPKPHYTGAYDADFLEGRAPRMSAGYVSTEKCKGRRVLQRR